MLSNFDLFGNMGNIYAPYYMASSGGPPAWVIQAGGVLPDYDFDLANNRVWVNSNSSVVTPASLLTVSRASTEYYTDASGNLSSIANNTLAIGSAGLQAWEQRTNILTHSQDLNNWSAPTNATVTPNSTAAPDGTTTSNLITDNSTNGAHFVTAGATSYTSGSVYTYSMYAKQGTTKYVQLVFSNVTFAPAGYANFDLNAGVVTMSSNLTNITCTPVINGWYRLSATYTASATGASYAGAVIMNPNNTSSFAPSYVGTGSTVYIWGAQMELGNMASPYIPTITTTVTRAADVITMSGLTVGSSATILGIGIPAAPTSYASNQQLVNLTDGVGNNILSVFRNTSANFQGSDVVATVSQYSPTSAATWATATSNKVALAATAGTQNFSHAGTAEAAGTGVLFPLSLVQLNVGVNSTASGAYFNGNITRATVWLSTALSSANLNTITT